VSTVGHLDDHSFGHEYDVVLALFVVELSVDVSYAWGGVALPFLLNLRFSQHFSSFLVALLLPSMVF